MIGEFLISMRFGGWGDCVLIGGLRLICNTDSIEGKIERRKKVSAIESSYIAPIMLSSQHSLQMELEKKLIIIIFL